MLPGRWRGSLAGGIVRAGKVDVPRSRTVNHIDVRPAGRGRGRGRVCTGPKRGDG